MKEKLKWIKRNLKAPTILSLLFLGFICFVGFVP